jgi:hypothetical protein
MNYCLLFPSCPPVKPMRGREVALKGQSLAGGIGPAAGCAYGMHERNKYDRQKEGRSSSDQKSGNDGRGY